jgi:hypothetical protein
MKIKFKLHPVLGQKFKKLISSKRLLKNHFKVFTCVQTEINFRAALGEGYFRAGAVRRRPPGHVTRLTYSTDQLFSLKGLSHENKISSAPAAAGSRDSTYLQYRPIIFFKGTLSYSTDQLFL